MFALVAVRSHPSCVMSVMFRVELKSCEESRILLGKRFSSVQGFVLAGVCVIFIKSLQDNRYLHGLPVFFGTKLFQYKFIE